MNRSDQTLYENINFQSNRTKRQTLLLDVVNEVSGESLKTFNLRLAEPLIIDKLSDVYLDDKLYADMIIDEGVARSYDGKTKKGWC